MVLNYVCNFVTCSNTSVFFNFIQVYYIKVVCNLNYSSSKEYKALLVEIFFLNSERQSVDLMSFGSLL